MMNPMFGLPLVLLGWLPWQVRHTHEHNEMDLEEKSVLLRRRFHAFRKNVISIDYAYLV